VCNVLHHHHTTHDIHLLDHARYTTAHVPYSILTSLHFCGVVTVYDNTPLRRHRTRFGLRRATLITTFERLLDAQAVGKAFAYTQQLPPFYCTVDKHLDGPFSHSYHLHNLHCERGWLAALPRLAHPWLPLFPSHDDPSTSDPKLNAPCAQSSSAVSHVPRM
jgi:hypothetical protein